MPRKASPSKRQKFPPEYKLEAVRLSSEGTKSVAAQLGIDKHQLYRWLRAFERSGNSSFPGNGKIASQDEALHQLRRQLKVDGGTRFSKQNGDVFRRGFLSRYEYRGIEIPPCSRAGQPRERPRSAKTMITWRHQYLKTLPQPWGQ
jgi:transposase-like protein